MSNLAIQQIAPGRLRVWERNAKVHSKKQIGQIADSISTFGFTNPILIDEDYHILAGHGRVEAAKHLGMETVPCVRLDHMSEAQKRAYVIADNRLAENAGWDQDILAIELGELAALDLDFDIEITGFSTPEIDLLIDGSDRNQAADPRAEAIPSSKSTPKRCQPGDVWQMGDHWLFCGDARDGMRIRLLMRGEKADVIITDPPFNVRVNGHVSGTGRHQEFSMASGEMSQDAFTCFLKESFESLVRYSKDGSLHYIFMDWRHQREILDAAEGLYQEQKNLIIWDKGVGGMGSFYRSQHELIFVFKNGTAPHANNFELGQHGRSRSNIWRYPGANSGGAKRQEELAAHPTPKPVQLITDAIKDVTPRRGLVLDLFAGAGATVIAAEQVGRRAYLAEISPAYCDTILCRWEQIAHGEAQLIHRSVEIEEAAE